MFAITTPPEPGASLFVYANRGMRPATVLAVQGQQALVEYCMPRGTTSLRLIDLGLGVDEICYGRPLSYQQVSPGWLQAVIDADQRWIGHPQQHGLLPTQVPPIEMLLLQKRFVLAFRRFWRSQVASRLLSQIRMQRGCWNVTGWEKGGCGIAALTLLGWIRALPEWEKNADVYLWAMAGRGHQAAHVFVSVGVDGKQELCLDPSGLRSRSAMIQRWSKHYHLVDAHIMPLDENEQAFKSVRVPYNSEIGMSLSMALIEALGAFPLFLLFPSSGGF